MGQPRKISDFLFCASFLALAAAHTPANLCAQEQKKSGAVESPVRSGAYAEAAALLEKHARAGNADAQYQLASLYRIGRGVAHDDAEAFRWMRQAAKAGHVRAQYSLASTYLNGRGTSVDVKAAEIWAQRAADKGHDKAAALLADIVAKQSAPKEAPSWKAAAAFDAPQAISSRAAAVTPDTGKALIDAARRGNLEAVNALIKRGARLESRDDDGNTALALAAGAGHARIVEALLSAGANANARNSSQETPLIRAASQNRGPELEILAKVSDVNSKRADKATALTLALRRCNENAVIALLAANVSLSSDGGEPSPLALASRSCSVGIVKALLDRSALVNQADALGRTPL